MNRRWRAGSNRPKRCGLAACVTGDGDDLYLVGSAGDRVTETANSGDDTVVSYGEDYTLPDHVENLTVQTLGELATEGFAGTNT